MTVNTKKPMRQNYTLSWASICFTQKSFFAQLFHQQRVTKSIIG